jgi:hypothetical protein
MLFRICLLFVFCSTFVAGAEDEEVVEDIGAVCDSYCQKKRKEIEVHDFQTKLKTCPEDLFFDDDDLFRAVTANNEMLVSCLLKRGARTDVVNDYSWTALMVASRNGKIIPNLSTNI